MAAELTDEQLAARLTREGRRPIMLTTSELAAAISENGKDGVAVLDRVLPRVRQAAEASPTVAIEVEKMFSGGETNFANPLVRGLISRVADTDDTLAIFEATPVPEPVTAEQVRRDREKAILVEMYGEILNEEVTPVLDADDATARSVAEALQRAAVRMERS